MTFITAEIGINHNGDLKIAKKLIKIAKDTGCDAVKFQKRNPDVCVPEFKKKLLKSKKIKFVINKNYKKGISSSIKTGLRSLSKRNKGFLIVQADMPNITKTTINKIILLINKSPKEIFLPKFKNRVGNPIGFKKSMIKNINKIKGDRGAKNIIKKNSTKIKFINIMTIIASTKPYLAFGQAKRAILSGVLFLFSSEFVSGIF